MKLTAKPYPIAVVRALAVTLVLAASAWTPFVSPALAQFSSTVSTQKHDLRFSSGRDFWIIEMSNYWNSQTGGYQNLYITSSHKTTANILCAGQVTTMAVGPGTAGKFSIPRSQQLESSGIIENKSVHVWSNDADLTVYNINHGGLSTDGEYIIPTVGWGTDYVVATYGSLFEGSGSFFYDYPSECAIIANTDNTVVSITPSCDCRQCTSGSETPNGCASVVVYPKGKQFFVTLQQGQCMELMPVLITNPDNFDLSGTVIHSSKPVGVFGGSNLVNIPQNYPYANHVEDMIPPIRTWGKTYFSSSYAQAGVSGRDYSQSLFISTEANHTIYRVSCSSGTSAVEAVVADQYGTQWEEEEGGQEFYSDQPFLCVQYENNATYPDGSSSGSEGAEEGHLNPVEQYVTDLTFIAAPNYTDNVNIVLNDSDAANTFFDGAPIKRFPTQCSIGNWKLLTIEDLGSGPHTISGDDSGVYAYVYGYTNGFAASCPMFVGTFHSPDTAPPVADISNGCQSSDVVLIDSGTNATGIAAIWTDSSYNMTLTSDPSFQEGNPTLATSFSASPTHSDSSAYARVTAYDLAGNSTTVTLNYTPAGARIVPASHYLGIFSGGAPNIAYDTIQNLGKAPFTIDELRLLHGDRGFSIYDSSGGPLDQSAIPGLGRRVVEIQFDAKQFSVDTIILGSSCDSAIAVLTGGMSGVRDLTVSSQTWQNEPLGGCYQKTVNLSNLWTDSLTIDSAWWSDTAHFKPMTALPIILPRVPATVPFTIEYCPDSNSSRAPNMTIGHWTSPQVLDGNNKPIVHLDTLTGSAEPQSGVLANIGKAAISVTPIGRELSVKVSATIVEPFQFELVNVLGERMMNEELSGPTRHLLDINSLPTGIYFWRITSGAMSQIGKIILGN